MRSVTGTRFERQITFTASNGGGNVERGIFYSLSEAESTAREAGFNFIIVRELAIWLTHGVETSCQVTREVKIPVAGIRTTV